MDGLKVFFRTLEYVPIIGIIPGAIRLSALNKDEGKAHDIAMKCLQSTNSTSGECTRGIISCIPFVNTFVLPVIDIIQSLNCLSFSEDVKDSKAINTLSKGNVKQIEDLKEAKAAIEVMGKIYEEFLAMNKHDKSNYLYSVEFKVKEKEWKEAVGNAYKFSKNYFDKYDKVNHSLKEYDVKMFMHYLDRFAFYFEPQRPTRTFLSMDCTADGKTGSTYLRAHYKTFLEDIDAKIFKLSQN